MPSRLQIGVAAGVFVGVLGVYSFWWTKGLRERNKTNLENAHLLWNLVEDQLGVKSPRYQRGEARRLASSHWTSWSHGSQIAVTALLAVLDFLSLWLRTHSNPK